MFSQNEKNWNEGTFGCSPGTKTGTRVRSRVPGTKTGTRARSPKPPFYETALLSPSDLRGADTQTPTRHSVFSTHSDTQAVPAFHCIRMFKGIFRRSSVFKTHRHAVYHCLKKVQKPFRHASVFKTLAFRHARDRFLNACPKNLFGLFLTFYLARQK